MATQTMKSSQGGAAAVGKPVRVGDLLIERRLISQEQLCEAIDYQRNKGQSKLLGEILIELGYVSSDQMQEALADAYGVPFAHITPKLVDPRVVELLPRDFLEKHNVLPLFHVCGKLTVAVHEPSNVFLIEEIQRLADCPVQIVVSTQDDITGTLQSYLPQANVFVIDDLMGDVDVDTLNVVDDEITDLTNFDETVAGESPVIKLVNHLIGCGAQEGASDIHIEPGEKSLRVRFRVDGILYEKMRPPYQLTAAIISRIKILAGMDISERRLPQDGGLTVVLNRRHVDLRISTMPGKYGEKVVMRLRDHSSGVVRMDQLGFSYEMLDRWRQISRQPNGIILVTGPTGSGKSTTLYATLSELIDDSVNISTVEDPIENHIEDINQFQTNEKAGFTFASALRALLRQDPDVIMVGEIRDQETARIATQAALTGHLVVSTLHTNDAPSAITRLFNIGVEPYLVAATVNGVLAQRLLRRICKHCKEPAELSPTLRRSLDRLTGDLPPIEQVYQGLGCPKCRNTGFSGRIGVYELFTPDDELLDAVSRGASLQELRRLAGASGRYTTLRQDGLEKIRSGITTVEELLTATTLA